MKKLISILFLAHLFLNGYSQQGNSYTLIGKVQDKSTGEDLVGVNISVENTTLGVITDLDGSYAITLQAGVYNITYSYLGYETQTIHVQLTGHKKQNIQLQETELLMNTLEVSGKKLDANVTDLAMSVQTIPIEVIKKMPALMGEVDVIKSIQLLPGVQAAAEGSSGFSVRGGGTDQNLILFDDATIYNASHLMGFFSVFNNDVVSDATLYKGDIPAMYGGRLSSVLDVASKTPNMTKFKGSGGIGLISSRFAIEGPIVKDKLSFMAAGRRTYADLFLPLASDENLRESKLYFYDLNGKIQYNIDSKNRISVSGYYGVDRFANDFAGFDFGNASVTAQWGHTFSDKFLMKTSLLFTRYAYGLEEEVNQLGMEWTSYVRDYTAKVDFTNFLGEKNTLRYGLAATYHHIKPGDIKSTGMQGMINDTLLAPKKALEYSFYIGNEQELTKRISLKYGLRASAFQNMGEETVYNYDADYNIIDSTHYGSGKIYHTYFGIEPRAGLVWTLPAINSSVKAAYSHTVQNMILGSNSTGGMPLDVWFPANPNIKPQQSDQYTLGFFKNFFDNKLEMSIEGYYKKINHLIDFKDNPMLLGNAYIDPEIRTGKGYSYGVELLLRKNVGQFTGWVSYTYSRSFRKVPGVSFGEKYHSPFDRPHNIAVVLSYDITPRINVSANWLYSTGQPVTYPSGKMAYGNLLIPVYSGYRNEYRYPDYHRLDLSVTLKSKEYRRLPWRGEWNFSLYNAYAHKNVWAVMFIQEAKKPGVLQSKMVYLFSVVPSVTYNFYF